MRTVTFTPRPRTSGLWIALAGATAALFVAQVVIVAVRVSSYPFAEAGPLGAQVWIAMAVWLAIVALAVATVVVWPRIARRWQPVAVVAGPSLQAASFGFVAMFLGLAVFGAGGSNAAFGRTLVYLTGPTGLLGIAIAVVWTIWLVAASHARR